MLCLGCVNAEGQLRNMKPGTDSCSSDAMPMRDARCRLMAWSANSREWAWLRKAPQRRRAWQRMRVKTTCSHFTKKRERWERQQKQKGDNRNAGDRPTDGFVVSLRVGVCGRSVGRIKFLNISIDRDREEEDGRTARNSRDRAIRGHERRRNIPTPGERGMNERGPYP